MTSYAGDFMSNDKPKGVDHPTAKCSVCGRAIFGWRMSHYRIRQTGAIICAECGGYETVTPLPPKPELEAL